VLVLAVAVLARRGLIVVGAVCLVAAALVASTAAAQLPARQPPVLVDAAHDGRFVTLTVVTREALAEIDSVDSSGQDARAGPPASPRADPFGATAISVTVGGGEPVRVSAPVLVFGDPPPGRTGIGASLRLGGTLTAAEAGDDVGFLFFASGEPRLVAPPPWYFDWANGLRAGFSAAARELPGDGGDLLPGLAIGDTGAVRERLDASMKASSLSHLTAVSGDTSSKGGA
jgi:competence protein ComEC